MIFVVPPNRFDDYVRQDYIDTSEKGKTKGEKTGKKEENIQKTDDECQVKVSKNTTQDAQDEKHGVIEEKGGKESVGEGQMKEKCEKSDKKDENIQKTDEGQLKVSKKDTKQRKDEKKGRKWGKKPEAEASKTEESESPADLDLDDMSSVEQWVIEMNVNPLTSTFKEFDIKKRVTDRLKSGTI